MQTKLYRFVGSSCSLGNGEQLKRYGQKVELSEADAFEYIVNAHAALIPDEEFALAGHSDAELAKYPTIQSQTQAPAEFIARRAAAWKALYEHREALAASGAPSTEAA